LFDDWKSIDDTINAVVVVAAIGAVVGDFGLVDLRLVLGYGLLDLHLLFYLVDHSFIFLFYY
jgi:hypothetical protein